MIQITTQIGECSLSFHTKEGEVKKIMDGTYDECLLYVAGKEGVDPFELSEALTTCTDAGVWRVEAYISRKGEWVLMTAK